MHESWYRELDKIIINGQKPLQGEVSISGSKNSAVGVIPAALAVEGTCSLENIPHIDDVIFLKEIMTEAGVKWQNGNATAIKIDAENVNTYIIENELVKKMRASYYLIGALLSRFGKAEVMLPGGCDFGYRPIDQHIKGFEALGAKVVIEHGMVKLHAKKLKGAQIYMDVSSVGSTINIMIAATKAEGTTVIENASKEPHVVDVANFLNAMGAQIRGAGTDVIRIKGVSSLPGGATHTVISDMIEAGTFMIAGAATRGNVTVKNVIPKHMESLSAKLMEMNVGINAGEDSIQVYDKGGIKKANIKTLPYPGFPTDLHPQTGVLLSIAEGTSMVTEEIWPFRFKYIDELKRLGAKIKLESSTAVIEGVEELSGAPVRVPDLRAGAAMVIAGLVARGQTEIYDENRCIDRGYENFVDKLKNLGADIERVSVQE